MGVYVARPGGAGPLAVEALRWKKEVLTIWGVDRDCDVEQGLNRFHDTLADFGVTGSVV